MKLDLILPTDTAEWRRQIEVLQKHGYNNMRRCNEHHIKIGEINYYPNTGTITTDPAHRHSQKGLEALLEVLERITESMNIIHIRSLRH
jgi:hypothetical protein